MSQRDWNKAIQAAAAAVPVFVDADGFDPDQQRDAVDVRSDIIVEINNLLKPEEG